jgi:hypothetical protein
MCLLTKHSLTTTLRFVNENICTEGDRNGSKSSYGPMLHSYIWTPYTYSEPSYVQCFITISGPTAESLGPKL